MSQPIVLKPHYARNGVNTTNSGKTLTCLKCGEEKSAVGQRRGWCRPCHEGQWRINKGLPPKEQIPFGNVTNFLKELDQTTFACRKCKERKPKEAFQVKTSKPISPPIYRSFCSDCHDPAGFLRLSRHQTQRVLDLYGNRCELCGCEKKGQGGLAIDHCHSGGFIRGLLCFTCNTGLGFFKDDVPLLLRAIDYLQKRVPILEPEPSPLD